MGSNASRKPDKLTVVKMAVQHIRILGRACDHTSFIILFTIIIVACIILPIASAARCATRGWKLEVSETQNQCKL